MKRVHHCLQVLKTSRKAHVAGLGLVWLAWGVFCYRDPALAYVLSACFGLPLALGTAGWMLTGR